MQRSGNGACYTVKPTLDAVGSALSKASASINAREATHVLIHAKLDVPEARLEHHALITDPHSSSGSDNKERDQGQAHIQTAHMTSRRITAKLVQVVSWQRESCKADAGFNTVMVLKIHLVLYAALDQAPWCS